MFWRDFFFKQKAVTPFKDQLIVLIMYSTITVTLTNNVTAHHLTSSTMELQYNLANPLQGIHLIIQLYLEHCNCTEKLCSDQ